MRLIYMRPLIFQASASTRARLAEKGMTPAKKMELERVRKVNLWLTLRNEKDMGAKEAAEAVGETVANLYRWQKDPAVHSTRPKTLRESKRTPELVEAVRQLRLEQKTWGKEKIARRLQEEGFDTSIATVGRILTDLIARGKVQAYDHFISGSRKRRKNKSSRPHAIRLPKGLKPTIPREIIQVDTVHVELPDGTKIYHINVICPVTRVCYGRPSRVRAQKMPASSSKT